MSETAKQLESLLTDQPQVPLRPNQVAEYEEEKQRLHTIVKAPAWQTGADRGAATKTYRRIEKMLESGAPKELDGRRQDQVAQLAGQLAGEIQEAMLPQSVMRRNPAGAVDSFRRREGSKLYKYMVKQYKRALRALDPSNTDQDYTNIERLRPSGVNPDGTSTFMVDAQIPGKFAMSPRAKENWPLGEPTARTAIGEVRERDEKKRKPMSPEVKAAALARLAQARAKQAEMRAQAANPNPTPSQEVPAEGATE